MIAPKIITEKTEVGWDLEPGTWDLGSFTEGLHLDKSPQATDRNTIKEKNQLHTCPVGANYVL